MLLDSFSPDFNFVYKLNSFHDPYILLCDEHDAKHQFLFMGKTVKKLNFTENTRHDTQIIGIAYTVYIIIKKLQLPYLGKKFL